MVTSDLGGAFGFALKNIFEPGEQEGYDNGCSWKNQFNNGGLPVSVCGTIFK